MNILLLNPNTSEFVTGVVAARARQVAQPGTVIHPVNGRFGARVIATRSEHAVAEHATLDALAEHAAGMDAVVLAVSYDTALLAAREMLDIPVVGLTEAALLTAAMVGTRTGVVIFGRRVLPLYQEALARHGLAWRVSAWRALESSAPYSAGDHSESDRLIVQAVQSMVDQDACEVVVLGGAVMAGVAQRLQDQVEVPLLEGLSCAVPMAEMLARMALPKPRVGSLAALPAREVVGLSPALGQRFVSKA